MKNFPENNSNWQCLCPINIWWGFFLPEMPNLYLKSPDTLKTAILKPDPGSCGPAIFADRQGAAVGKPVRWSTLLVFLCLFHTCALSQGFKPPSKGKAAIYFTRVSGLAFAIGFDFFNEKNYIGEFGGRNYMRYECDPGTHLFWASSENKDFLTADVKAGETYIVIVDVQLGVGEAKVGLKPITSKDRDFERAKKLIEKKSPAIDAAEEVESKNVKLAEFIQQKLKEYNEINPDERTYRHLSSDMAIPITLL